MTKTSRTVEDWERRIYGRVVALPEEAVPPQRGQLLAAMSVGAAIIRLRGAVSHLGMTARLESALAAFAQGHSALAIVRLHELDRLLADVADAAANANPVLRARGQIIVIAEALSQYAAYFDEEARP